MANKIFTYHSLHTLADDARSVPRRWQTGGHECPMTYAQACKTIVTGDDSQVPRAKQLLDKLMLTTREITVPMWENSVAGAFPSVPEFLMGNPENMMALTHVPIENTPLTVWMDLCSSAGVSLEELENRGIAVLALILKLQTIRPVQLNVCYGAPDNGCGIIIPWNTQPMDLATTCSMLCNGAVTRFPLMAILRNYSSHLIGMPILSVEQMRTFFGIPENDLAIMGTLVYDHECRSNPLAWVNKQLARYAQTD